MTESGQGASPMDELCRHLAGLTQAVKSLQEGYSRLEEQVQALSSSSNPQGASSPGFQSSPSIVMLPPEPRVPTPEKFAGERSKYRAFHNSCELYFALQPRTFSLEATKVGFVISLLTGEPQTWAYRLLEQKSISLDSLDNFFGAMSQLYEDPQLTATAEAALHSLQQGRRAAEDYAVDFRRWSADTDWNDAALRHQFRMGLSDPLKDELARVGVPQSLKDLIDLSIQIDRRLRERRSERSTSHLRPTWMLPKVPSPVSQFPPASSVLTPEPPEPMQLGLLRPTLTPEEKMRRRTHNLCLYCGESGHYVRACPNKMRVVLPLQCVHLCYLNLVLISLFPSLCSFQEGVFQCQ